MILEVKYTRYIIGYEVPSSKILALKKMDINVENEPDPAKPNLT